MLIFGLNFSNFDGTNFKMGARYFPWNCSWGKDLKHYSLNVFEYLAKNWISEDQAIVQNYLFEDVKGLPLKRGFQIYNLWVGQKNNWSIYHNIFGKIRSDISSGRLIRNSWSSQYFSKLICLPEIKRGGEPQWRVATMDNTKTIIRTLPSKYLVRLDTYGTGVLQIFWIVKHIWAHFQKLLIRER